MRPRLVPGLASHRIIQAACGGSHTMALSDEGQLFTWGRCSSGRQGFHAPATVELPQQLQLPGGAERWHPICIAAGGRHSAPGRAGRPRTDGPFENPIPMDEVKNKTLSRDVNRLGE